MSSIKGSSENLSPLARVYGATVSVLDATSSIIDFSIKGLDNPATAVLAQLAIPLFSSMAAAAGPLLVFKALLLNDSIKFEKEMNEGVNQLAVIAEKINNLEDIKKIERNLTEISFLTNLKEINESKNDDEIKKASELLKNRMSVTITNQKLKVLILIIGVIASALLLFNPFTGAIALGCMLTVAFYAGSYAIVLLNGRSENKLISGIQACYERVINNGKEIEILVSPLPLDLEYAAYTGY